MRSRLKMIGLTIVKIIVALIVPSLIVYYLFSGEARDYQNYLYKNTPYIDDNSAERSGNATP